MNDICTTVQIETIAHCNATCDFCPVGFLPFNRPQGVMPDSLYRKIVDDAVDMGVTTVIPFLNGEPLMDKHLFDRLDYIAAKGLRTVIFTNGSLLNKAKADRLATYTNIDSITFSFHGGDEYTYEKVMGLNFNYTRKNIDYFLTITQVPTNVYLLSYEHTRESVDAFKQLWREHAFVSEAYFTWGGLTESQRARLLEHPPQPCQRLLHHMTVLVDGRVNLCCMDFHGAVILGDVNQMALADIWAGNQAMRNRHKRYDFDMALCRDCSMNRYGV